MKVRNRVVRCLLLLLALALLTGCTPEANVSTPAPTSTTLTPVEVYPTELEQDFVVLCERMEDHSYAPNPSLQGVFCLITKMPITEADITVKTGDILWQPTLVLRECYIADNSFTKTALYGAFLAYKDMDWAGLYDTATQSATSASEVFTQYWDACAEKWEAWYPGFYCYQVGIREPDCSALRLEGPHTETDLSVTVCGSTSVLEDVCEFVIHDESGAETVSDDVPLRVYEMAISYQASRPTSEGYFYSSDDALFKAKKDITITGARFQYSTTARFLEMELIVDGVRISWDGKTPVDVAAGEIVQFRYIAQDPVLGNVLTGSFTRNAVLELICEGMQYDRPIWNSYYINLDAYQCYAIADGRRDALYSYFVDYYNKASGWQPGYVVAGYDGTGETGNPFLDG